MALVVEMPRLSDTMREGTIVTWLKKEGDEVESGELLAEVETDKAVMEFEAEEDGVLRKVFIGEKEPAPIGTPICIIGEADEDLADAMAEADTLRAQAQGGGEKATPEAAAAPAPAAAAPAAAAPAAAPAPAPMVVPATALEANSDGRMKTSPLARKMAQDKGLSLAAIQGTGPGGRIVKRDVLSALERGIGRSGGGGSGLSVTAVPGVLPPVTAPPFVDEATSQMRKIIAERLVESKEQAPHFYLQMSVDMERAMDLRKQLNNLQDTVKISVNDLIVKAVALAGRDVPQANASWIPGANGAVIRRYSEVHVGIAVALEDGLVTPVVRDAGSKSLLDTAIEIRTLATAARGRKLGGEYYGNNTVTVSNLGMFGVESFTAIINPPAAIILAVGAVEQVPMVKEGTLTVGTQMKVTLSCDHRVVDGALGAQWLGAFKKHLENPISLVL
jgi:pyruvate dehydrogenase E2 component (dihydrolipoamide acetyltransferase)